MDEETMAHLVARREENARREHMRWGALREASPAGKTQQELVETDLSYWRAQIQFQKAYAAYEAALVATIESERK